MYIKFQKLLHSCRLLIHPYKWACMAAGSVRWDDAGKTTDSREQNALLESKIKAGDESRSWEMQLLPLSSWLVVSCLRERQQLLMWAELQVRGSSDLLLLQRCQHLSMLSAVSACRTCLRCVWCVLNTELDMWSLFWSLFGYRSLTNMPGRYEM